MSKVLKIAAVALACTATAVPARADGFTPTQEAQQLKTALYATIPNPDSMILHALHYGVIPTGHAVCGKVFWVAGDGDRDYTWFYMMTGKIAPPKVMTGNAAEAMCELVAQDE